MNPEIASNQEQAKASQERIIAVRSGWTMLPAVLFSLGLSVVLFISGIVVANHSDFDYGSQKRGTVALLIIASLLLFVSTLFALGGFFTLQPNEARLLILFGQYVGTVRESGFYWANPFYNKLTDRVSLRARNLTGEKLKVNDKRGNPIEIGAVIVWRVYDTAMATFDVENYDQYVRIQSESAIRHLAGMYAYDHASDGELTLQSGADEVASAMRTELQQRLAKAGVTVDEARLTHLAYAPEIAQAMLRRQQAEAVIAAREKIVHGAVSMVDMAIRELSEKQVIVLDDERKAAMVSNLMVVLCAEAEVRPVIDTGTLHN